MEDAQEVLVGLCQEDMKNIACPKSWILGQKPMENANQKKNGLIQV